MFLGSLRPPVLASWCFFYTQTVSKSVAIATSQRSHYSMSVWEDNKATAIQKCILPLSEDSHKGSSGRIGILGGSLQYTGAPYYGGIAALKAGADLVYVFCAEEAAVPIKSYSPELMVQSVYKGSTFEQEGNHEADIAEMVETVTSSLERLHCLTIGPGLGRNKYVLEAVKRIIANAIEQNLFLVLDADALFLVSQDPSILKDYEKVVLTPNVVEYKRLFENPNATSDLSKATILEKGKYDEIHAQEECKYVCQEPGGLKRSGGIGDVLSGTVSTLVGWHQIMNGSDLALSCWTASCIVKRATRRAFSIHHRAMSAQDVIEQIGPAMYEMTEE